MELNGYPSIVLLNIINKLFVGATIGRPYYLLFIIYYLLPDNTPQLAKVDSFPISGA